MKKNRDIEEATSTNRLGQMWMVEDLKTGVFVSANVIGLCRGKISLVRLQSGENAGEVRDDKNFRLMEKL